MPLPSALRNAFALHGAGRHAEAAEAFRALLARQPRLPQALHGLSLALEAAGDAAGALAAAREAIAAAPENPGLHYTLGLMHTHQAQTVLAAECYRHAVRLRPDFGEAWNNLGLALAQQGALDEACACFEEVLRLAPGHVGARSNLASVLHEAGRDEEALARLAQATALAPDNAACHANFGRLCVVLRRFAAAVASFEKALAIGAGDAALRRDYAEALIGLSRLDDACDVLTRVLADTPGDAQAAWRLAWVQTQMNAPADAIATYRATLARDPTDWHARMGTALTLPIIQPSAAAVRLSREKYSTALDDLAAAAPQLPVADDPATLARQIEWDNFHLAYQGEDDAPLQVRYASLLQSLLARGIMEPPAPRAHVRRERLRIGFASAYFHDCTVGHYFRSWITDLDARRFERFVYALGPTQDALSETVRQAADRHVRLTGNIIEIARAIRTDAPDILVYPELGMHGRTFALAGLRLAPVQCAGWGHPVTTGHPTIDHFLSSALMEPADGARHYAEHLVLLPGLGTCYTPPRPSLAKSRADLGLPDGRHLYLSPQSLFKIHPDNDGMLGEILAHDADGVLVLFEAEYPWLTRAFRERLAGTLRRRNVNPARVLFLPLMDRRDYLDVNCACDVMLDTVHWSGGNTTLDALAAGLPVVTQWGRFMRGRQSAGMLTALGVPELIAADPTAYVDLAVALGKDRKRRDEIAARIVTANGRLFGDLTPIRALETFFASAADQTGGAENTSGARNSSART